MCQARRAGAALSTSDPLRPVASDLVQSQRPVTILDVAARAGVHAGTVSRALSKPEQVSDATRERVEAAVRELGFVPNRAARGLKMGRTGNVAVIVPDITNPHFASLVRAIEHAARDVELQVLLVDTGEQAQQEVDAARSLANDVDGFIVLSARRLHRELGALGPKRAVFVNRPVSDHAAVLLRTGPAIDEALRHLAAFAHKTLAYVAGPRGSWAAGERRDAVRRTSRLLDMQVVEFPVTQPTFEAATAVVDGIVASGATAVMAFNDQMALGILTGLTKREISVPRDISVVGCDNVPMAAMVAPPLTTIGMPTIDAGAAAVALLHGGISTVELFGTFVPRGSTGPADPLRPSDATARRPAPSGAGSA